MSEIVVSTWAFGERANVPGWEILKTAGSALDAVVAGVSVAEKDPEVKSVGYGGYPNADGEVEVDAAVMDGRNLGYGSVVALKNIDVPTAVARDVMEKTDHVMLAGEGALAFGRSQGYSEREMLTDGSRKAWEEWKAGRSGRPTDSHDTIGLVALDQSGDIVAACTTSGLGFKMKGRVGDSPLIGSGLYADNEVGAAAATGRGEEIARVCGSFLIVEFMRQCKTPQEACEESVTRLLDRVPDSRVHQMAFIALNRDGQFGAAAARDPFPYAAANANGNRLLAGICLQKES